MLRYCLSRDNDCTVAMLIKKDEVRFGEKSSICEQTANKQHSGMTSTKTKQDPAVVAAQNRRKIEKDKRRKNYHDSQVQGTNNSSIVSKRSVELIYNPLVEPQSKEWFKHFVPKGKRRSPAINRGYWVRMESIKQTVYRLQKQYQQTIRVVNLGCGFDPFPFKTLAESDKFFDFYDFDYPDLVAKKLAMIKLSPEIMDVIGEESPIEDSHKALGVVMSTSSYKLVGCDLKDTALYKKQLECLLHSGIPTVFIAEVSLAYMKPEHANPVVEILSLLQNSHILVLEQIMPSGDSHFFAQKMLYHFSHLRSPLQCVETYSTKEKQKARFLEYFPSVEIIDLFESWNQLVSPETKQLVARVEDFDEWEEFIVFCQHYVVIHATNSDHSLFHTSPDVPPLSNIEPLEITTLETPINAKFPACAKTSKHTFIHGGMFQTRSDELVCLDEVDLAPTPTSETKPSARMCHTFTDLKNGNLLLIGGRTRPGVELSDIWAYNETNKTWKEVGDVGKGLARHSAISFGDNSVLVYGNGEFKLITYHDEQLRIVNLKCEGFIPELTSCALTYDADKETGYVIGGTLEEVGPSINNELFLFIVNGTNITIKSVKSNAHFARIGCMAKIESGHLYIAGGLVILYKTRILR